MLVDWQKELLKYLFSCEIKESYGDWSYKGDTKELDWEDIDEIGSSFGIRDEDINKVNDFIDFVECIYKKA